MELYKHEMKSGKKDPVINAVMARMEKIISKNKQSGRVGFSTGFDVHKNIYYRYYPGHIWTIGGFTSVGKTAVMVQKICNMITDTEQPKILVISTEMAEEQVVSRIIANFTGIHSMRILNGNFHSAEEQESAEEVKRNLKMYPISIYDDIYQLTDIETAIRKADLQGGVNVVFIDYVQNCKWSEAKSQYHEQAEMAKRFQSLAKETKSTIICLSQVSNDVGRGNTDQLELKGAGEWAAVSDFSAMLTRNKLHKYLLKYTIKKNRHGALGECELEFKNDYTRIEEKH
jgi:replicative DNA helicase